MRKNSDISVAVVVLLIALALPVGVAAQQVRYTFIDIPTLGGASANGQNDGPGASQFINNSGVVVGGSDTITSSHGFRWQDGVLTDLGALGNSDQNWSGATSVNAFGWATGGGSNPDSIDPLTGGSEERAVLWKGNQIMNLGTLGSGIESAGLYVKDDGEVVGFSTVDTTIDPFAFVGFGPFPSPTHAFIWKNGVMQDLGTLGGPDSFLSPGCNNERSGTAVGSSFTNYTPNATTGVPTLQAFLWENGAMTKIPTLGGTFAAAQCANSGGQVIGQSSLQGDPACDPNNPMGTCAEHAFSWNAGVLTDLKPFSGGSFSLAIWLNDAGQAVGGATSDTSFHAALWQNGHIVDLGTLDGDCFSIANAINSSGQIIGQSFSCDGTISRAVVWINRSIVDLNAVVPSSATLQLVETDNINDHGEIVGRGLPAGCDDVNGCGRVFLLIPCDVAGASCTNTPGGTTVIATTSTISPGPQKTKEFVAQLRARLRQHFQPKRPSN